MVNVKQDTSAESAIRIQFLINAGIISLQFVHEQMQPSFSATISTHKVI